MPHIEELVVQNYRVLKEFTLDGLQPMSVVLGPYGCGKSTLFDVFGFLSDALQTNVKARSSTEAGYASFDRETALARSESRFGIGTELTAICMVVSLRVIDGVPSSQIRYFIGSAAGTAKGYLQWVRGHWGIENSLQPGSGIAQGSGVPGDSSRPL
ncbi:MAG: hypothetical protein ABSH35_35670 [Isosphaeraceae bacterium]|jgi:energy-coupling factor transporter ATP-binding protein EcfA2